MQDNLSVLLDEFFLQIKTVLKQTSENAGSFEDQNAYTEAITNLHYERESVSNEFFRAVTSEIEHVSEPKTKSNIQDLEERNLTLIDKHEFEGWLNLSTIIRCLGEYFKVRLMCMNQKISHVTGIPKGRSITRFVQKNYVMAFVLR